MMSATIHKRYMLHTLNIITGNNPVREVKAETNLGPSPQLDVPELITGQLQLNETEALKLAASTGKEAGFEGYRYRFERLEKDGTFELARIHPPEPSN